MEWHDYLVEALQWAAILWLLYEIKWIREGQAHRYDRDGWRQGQNEDQECNSG